MAAVFSPAYPVQCPTRTPQYRYSGGTTHAQEAATRVQSCMRTRAPGPTATTCRSRLSGKAAEAAGSGGSSSITLRSCRVAPGGKDVGQGRGAGVRGREQGAV